jgi:hypothetical protein
MSVEHNNGAYSDNAHRLANRYQVAVGLAVSIGLLLLSLPTSVFYKGSNDDKDMPIDAIGLLHAIWMYRNHAELEALLPQVEDPTVHNLREAGMVRTRLVSRVDLRRRRSCESFVGGQGMFWARCSPQSPLVREVESVVLDYLHLFTNVEC